MFIWVYSLNKLDFCFEGGKVEWMLTRYLKVHWDLVDTFDYLAYFISHLSHTPDDTPGGRVTEHQRTVVEFACGIPEDTGK